MRRAISATDRLHRRSRGFLELLHQRPVREWAVADSSDPGICPVAVWRSAREGDQIEGQRDLADDALRVARVEPVYDEIKGWKESTQGARSWADLPARAIKYVRRIEELIRCPVALVSTSPERDDTILVRDPFAG